LPQDPAREFLASAKQFEVPLAELGRYIQGSQTDYPEQPSFEMFLSKSRGRNSSRKPESSTIGKVLVEATPSISGSSQSQPSQPSQIDIPDTDLYTNRQPDIYDYEPGVANVSQESQNNSPSSSYERFLAGEPEPGEVQLEDENQATQPSTQPGNITDVSDADAQWGTGTDVHTSGANTSHNWITPAALTTSTVASDPRALASMVNPNKKWRFTKYGQEQAAMHTSTSSTRIEMDREALVETQPSGESESAAESVVVVNPQPPQAVGRPTRKRHVYGQPSDITQIVPDSEPPTSTSEPTPIHEQIPPQPLRTNVVASGRVEQGGSQLSEVDTEIVPDSFSTHDHDESDEDDVSLWVPANETPKAKPGLKVTTRRRPLEMTPVVSPVKVRDTFFVTPKCNYLNVDYRESSLMIFLRQIRDRTIEKHPNHVLQSMPIRPFENSAKSLD
jgi:hypothetical protein